MCGLFGSVDNARFSVAGDVLAMSFRDWKVDVGLIAVTKDAMLVQRSLYRTVLSYCTMFQLQCVLTVHASTLKKELQVQDMGSTDQETSDNRWSERDDMSLNLTTRQPPPNHTLSQRT